MRYLGLLMLPFLVAGCVTRVPMNTETLGGKTFEFNAVRAGEFTEKTFENFNNDWWSSKQNPGAPRIAIGVNREGVKKFDPSPKVSAAVKSILTQELGMKEAKKNADYTAGLRWASWGIKYHPVALTTYNIFYETSMYLEGRPDAKGKRAREYFTCSYKTDSKYNYDEAHDMNTIKEVMETATDQCITELGNKLRAEIKADSK